MSQILPPVQSIVTPEIRGLLNILFGEVFANINCVQVGTIVGFDASVGTVQVQLVLKRSVYNSGGNPVAPANPAVIDYPVLVDVPVWTPQGGAGVLTMPITNGDGCVVLFNDRDLDPWWHDGTLGSIPNDARMHSLADGIAFVGIRSKGNAIANWDPAKAQLRNNGGLLSVDAKLKISNAATSMKTVLDTLATLLLSWVDTAGNTPNPATIVLINAFKTLADSLLE